MNENINLCEILKDVPKGTKLWSPMCGEVKFLEVDESDLFSIKAENNSDFFSFISNGKYYNEPDAECVLFPSRNQRDWSKFKMPEKEKERVNLKNVLKPFSRVLVRDGVSDDWKIAFFSHHEQNNDYQYIASIEDIFAFCIPYEGNEDLFGTNEVPDKEYYWEE